MSLLRRSAHAQSIWSSGFIRALAGQGGGATGAGTVLRSLGQFVPLTHGTPQWSGLSGGDRDDVVLELTRSGELSVAEAEQLLALDESTPWFDRA